MAIRYVDIEPEDGRPKAVRAPKSAPAASEASAATPPAEDAPAPAAKPKRRKK